MESTLTTSRTSNMGSAPPRLSNATLVTAAGLAAVALTAARRANAEPPAPVTLTFANPPANPGPLAVQITGTGDIKVLNYALVLETLEADLYSQALTRLTELSVSTSDPAYVYVNTFAPVEANHRDFLANALGSAAITAPSQPLASGALSFDFGLAAMTNPGQVLQLIYTVEDTGTKAYIGAIPYFTDTTYLGVAGAIQGTEARHTSTLAIVLRGEYNITTDLFGNVVETAPLAGNNNGIDPSTYTPDFVLSKVSGPSGFILFHVA